MSDQEGEAEAELELPVAGIMTGVPSLIPFPGKLDLEGNISTNWKKFKHTWDNYEIASGLAAKDGKIRTATLLTWIFSMDLPLTMRRTRKMWTKCSTNLKHSA